MRISDWSSDVCSSDLSVAAAAATSFRSESDWRLSDIMHQPCSCGCGKRYRALPGSELHAGEQRPRKCAGYASADGQEVRAGSCVQWLFPERVPGKDRKSTRLNSRH